MSNSTRKAKTISRRFWSFNFRRNRRPQLISAWEKLMMLSFSSQVAWTNTMIASLFAAKGAKFVEYSYDAQIGKILVYVVTEDGKADICFWQVDGDPRDLENVLEGIYVATSRKVETEYFKRKKTLIKRLEELYEAFIRPIADLLKPMNMEDKLIFVGSEILSMISFQILRDPSSGAYLFQHHTIAFSSSLPVLKHCSSRLSTLKKLPLIQGTPGAGVVVGDPAYKDPKDRIKGTPTEVDRMTKLFRSDTVVNIQDTGANVKAGLDLAELHQTLLRSQGFLHYAVHGLGGQYAGDKKLAVNFKASSALLMAPDPNANSRVRICPPSSVSHPTRRGTEFHPTKESMENEPKLASNQRVLQSTQLAPEPAKVTEDSVGEVGVLKGRRWHS